MAEHRTGQGLRFTEYLKAAAAGGVVILAGLLLWRLSYVVILAFGAMIVAAILTVCADAVERWTPLKGGWAKAAGWLLLALLLVGFAWLLGAQVLSQIGDLIAELPGMIARLGTMLGVEDLYDELVTRVAGFAQRGTVLGDLAAYTTSLAGVLATLFIVVMAGVFLAIDPASYRRGVLALVPDGHAEAVDAGLRDSARALRLWLVGKVITMVVIGLTTGIALSILGLPSALALAVIAAIFEFIPFVGPFLAAAPAVLIAMPMGWTTVAWVVGIYLFIQQVESNILIPIVQRRAADLPPVVGLLSIVAFTILFGVPGALVGTPLTIVIIALVKRLYIRDALGHDTRIAGESRGGGDA